MYADDIAERNLGGDLTVDYKSTHRWKEFHINRTECKDSSSQCLPRHRIIRITSLVMAFKLVLLAACLALTSARPQVDLTGNNGAQGPMFDPNPVYTFNYQVADDETQNYMTHEESRDGDIVTGKYSYVDPNGALVTVTYQAGVMGYTEERTLQENFVTIRNSPQTTRVTSTSTNSESGSGSVTNVGSGSFSSTGSGSSSTTRGSGSLTSRVTNSGFSSTTRGSGTSSVTSSGSSSTTRGSGTSSVTNSGSGSLSSNVLNSGSGSVSGSVSNSRRTSSQSSNSGAGSSRFGSVNSSSGSSRFGANRDSTLTTTTTTSTENGNSNEEVVSQVVTAVEPAVQQVVSTQSTSTSTSKGDSDLVARIIAQLTPFIQQTVSNSLETPSSNNQQQVTTTTTRRVQSTPLVITRPIASSESSRSILNSGSFTNSPFESSASSTNPQTVATSATGTEGIFGTAGKSNVKFSAPEYTYEF